MQKPICMGMTSEEDIDPMNDGTVNPGGLAYASNVAPYMCLSRSGSGRFADCFQTSWEVVVSDAGDPVVM